MSISKGYGSRVQQTRLAMGVSMRGFAVQALSKGASAKNIGRIENEQVVPRADTLERIAALGKVDLAWLSTGSTAIYPTKVVQTPGIGARVASYRKARGLTMRELARRAKLGESSKNVGRIEIGEVRPRGATLGRLAAALDVSVEQLAFGN